MPGEELPPVVATFDANSTDFDEVVDHIEERLEVLSSIDAEPTVGIDDNQFDEKLDDIIGRFEALNDLSATAEAYLNGDEFNTRYDEIMRLMATLEAMYADPSVDLDDAAFERKFEYIEGKMALLERSINANMDLSIDEFESEYTLIEGQIAALEAQSPITIEVVANETGLAGIAAANEAWMAAQKTQSLFSLSQLPADLAAVAAGGGGGGGGGGVGLAALLGISRHRVPGTRLGIPLAGFGTLGAMAGFGLESAALTGVGVAGSGIGALLGGAALGTSALGVAGVGIGTDLAGIGQATGDTKQYGQLQSNLAQTSAVYGQGSVEYKAAQYAYQQWAQDLNTTTIKALATASNTATQFHAMFDSATAGAETTGAQIETQAMQIGEKFLPTIGKYAAQNTSIIQADLQPLFTWLQGPGVSAFNTLEQVFQEHLPAAMGAFDNGIELLIRMMAQLAPQTGGIVDKLDALFTKLNGADFGHFMGEVQNMIGIYHTWAGLIKNVADAIYELFHNDAGTGTAIIADLSRMIGLFDKWAAGPQGGDELHAFMEAHKKEILEMIDLLPHLISAFGGIELFVDPPLREMIGLLAQAADILLSLPIVGQVLAMGVAFEVLSHRISFLPSLVPMLKSIAIDGIQFLGSALTALGSASGIEWLETLGGKLSSFGTSVTPIEAAATAMQGAADSMSESAAQIVAALQSVGTEADLMAGQVEGSATASEAALGGLAADSGGVSAAERAAGGVGASGAVAGEGVAVEGAEVAGAGAATSVASLIPAATVAAAAAVVVAELAKHEAPQRVTQSTATNQSQEAGTNPTGSYGVTGGNLLQRAAQLPFVGPFVQTVLPDTRPTGPSPQQAAAAKSDTGAAEEAANIKQLSSASGLAAPQVQQLASALKINLNSALAPGSVQIFMNAVKSAGGATKEAADLTKSAAFEVSVGLQEMATKAQTAMPNVSGAARNMITAASPALVTLVADMKKSGDQSGAGWVAAYLAHLSPAELASKNLHDKVKSPLDTLVSELKADGDKAAANAVQGFIDKQPAGATAATNLASAIKNPLYDLQTQLASTGQISASQIVQEFEKANPQASTQAGLMEMAIKGKLNPLIADLKGVGDNSSAALVTSIQTNASKGNWDAVGASIDSGIASGITAHTGQVTQAAAGLASAASAATARVLKSSSPSQVFHELGRGISEGLANGINEQGHVAAKAAQALAGATVSGAASGSSSGSTLNLGGVHFNGSPDDITPEEAGAAAAEAVRIANLRRAKYQGPNGGVFGALAGTR